METRPVDTLLVPIPPTFVLVACAALLTACLSETVDGGAHRPSDGGSDGGVASDTPITADTADTTDTTDTIAADAPVPDVDGTGSGDAGGDPGDDSGHDTGHYVDYDASDDSGHDTGHYVDYDADPPDTRSPDTGDTADTRRFDADAGAFSCDDIPVNGDAGDLCTGAPGECPEGACVSPADGGDTTCMQICIPGVCDDLCRRGERCFALVDESGDPQTVPGTDLVLGVCQVPPEGSGGAFARCGGDAGACDLGLDCLVFAVGETFGQCFPSCSATGTCVEGSCAIAAGDDQYCALTCTVPGGGGECPEDMVCLAVSGGAICHYEELI